MPLTILIIGAGIAGLVAAASLRQAGHTVIVLEKSRQTTVVGAALHVNPNGGRVLARLGFDPVKAKACRPHHWDILSGTDLKQLSSMPLAATPGHPEPGTITIHRADLHRELLRVATTVDAPPAVGGGEGVEAWGPPVEIRLGAGVVRVSDDGSGVVLESGEEVRGDLVVGADGVHSVVREYVVAGEELGKAVHSGMAAFRFLLESDRLRADEELASLLDTANGVTNLLADVTETASERHMVWYACHG
jgi:salicylate hydroxylase